ncbi:MAG: CDP-diacylglycerol--glycerol-3-phosphate 3-phosphatidyltransferase [Planctomycetes bacterium]|nr:CDP-diacylglycerol--glycerol-3-phosphate 3-phosphatidyltransferase [Planctomycetota bacterium]
MGTEAGAAGHQQVRLVTAPAPITKNALALPNLITISRLFLAAALFTLIALYTEGYERNPGAGWWLTATFLFVLAAGTDFLDGLIARRWGLVSTLGRILDPFADKIIIVGAFVFLQDPRLNSGIASWMTIVVIGREMFVTSLRGFLEHHGRDFSASLSGKAKMIMQCIAVTASLLSLSPLVQSTFPHFNVLRDVLIWTTVAVTLYSGLLYIYRAWQMLRPQAV